jgi:hypothetical protein
MPEEQQESGWVLHPSLWFDAVCLIPLLAGLPFYTSRHDQDARWWQERFAAIAGREAHDGVSVLRHEVARRAAKPLPAFLALWTSPAAGPCARSAECRFSRPGSPGGTRMPVTTPGPATPRRMRPRRSTSSSILAWAATPEETR